MGARAAVLATLASAIVWGTSFAVNDLGLRAVDPYTFVFLRFLVAAASCFAVAAATGGIDVSLARDKRLWILGALNAAGFLGQYVGQCWTTPARTALFVNTNVFVVGVLSFFAFQERFGPGKIAAVGAAFAGVVLLSAQQGQPGACGAAWWGDAIVLAGALAWSFYIVANRAMVSGPGASLANVGAWTFLATAVFLAPFLAASPAPLAVSAEGVWPVVYSGIVTTTITFLLWSFGLRSLTATASAVIILVEVPVAVLISLALARESFTILSAAGGALLFAAVAYVSLAQAREEEAGAPAKGAKEAS